MDKNWKQFLVSPDETHHLFEGAPAYSARFLKVLKFHAPGLAPVQDSTGGYHINTAGASCYAERYLRTFGYYEERAAVKDNGGWLHITTHGKPLYLDRYAWAGNFQEKLCAVRNFEGRCFHLDYTGRKAYSNSFRYAGDFRDGYAVVQNDEGLSTHIDAQGKLLHGKWLSDLDVFHKGFARAHDGKGWFHIDRHGNPLYTERYAAIEPFYNGYARVEAFDGSRLIIDETGTSVHSLRSMQKDPFHIASAELVSYWRLYTLYCAYDLKIFDLFPISPSDAAQQINFPLESIIRLFRALQEMGLLSKCAQGICSLTETGAHFCSNHPHSLCKALQFWREEHHASWLELRYSLQTGESAFEKQHAIDWFSWLRGHAEKNLLFHEVMQTYASRDYQKVSSLLQMHNHKVVLDLGGSTGSLLTQLLNDYPHLTGVLLDLPEIIQKVQFESRLQGRVNLIGRDFFESWSPLHADAIFLARVLHDWFDTEAIAILKKACSCLTDAAHSKIYIIENLLNSTTGCGGLLDLNMLVMTKGKERTLEQYEGLLSAAGLALEQRIPLNEVTFILCAKRLA